MFVFDDRRIHGILDKESEPDQQHGSLAVLESSRLSNYRPRWLCSESCRTQQGSRTLFIFISDEDASQILSLQIYTAPRRLKDML